MKDALVEEGLDYFEKVGDDGDKKYVAAIRTTLERQAEERSELRIRLERCERHRDEAREELAQKDEAKEGS